jgi:Cu-Zn family superoxide dismutase
MVGGFAAVGPANAERERAKPRAATALLRDVDGEVVGRIHFRPARRTVDVRYTVAGLTPGFHGFHVHTTGRCDADTTDPKTGQAAPFLSAQGHFNPRSTTHGAHAGDMPPLLVMRDGRARGSFTMDALRVRHMLDADGSAVIVHGLADNTAHIPSRYHSHSTEPGTPPSGPDAATLATGDAGPRVACGLVRRHR